MGRVRGKAWLSVPMAPIQMVTHVSPGVNKPELREGLAYGGCSVNVYGTRQWAPGIHPCPCACIWAQVCVAVLRVNKGSSVHVNTGIGVCVHVAGWEMAASLQPSIPGSPEQEGRTLLASGEPPDPV